MRCLFLETTLNCGSWSSFLRRNLLFLYNVLVARSILSLMRGSIYVSLSPISLITVLLFLSYSCLVLLMVELRLLSMSTESLQLSNHWIHIYCVIWSAFINILDTEIILIEGLLFCHPVHAPILQETFFFFFLNSYFH